MVRKDGAVEQQVACCCVWREGSMHDAGWDVVARMSCRGLSCVRVYQRHQTGQAGQEADGGLRARLL